jgi:RimJ/RimL family protein N-acetyltransferase
VNHPTVFAHKPLEIGSVRSRHQGRIMTQLVEGTVQIRTQRLELRPLRATDADRLFMLINNWNVIRWLALPPWPYTYADAEAFIAAKDGPATDVVDTALAIALDDRLIGGIGLCMRPASRWRPAVGLNLGYWLGEPYWGHGYMTEAAEALVRHGFANRTDDAIYSGALVGNDASLRVQEKLGFVRLSEEMLYSRPRGGEVPHISMVLRRGDLR